MKEAYLASGQRICTYDDALDLRYRQHVYTFAQNSLFQIGWADSLIIEKQATRCLYSSYSDEDMRKLNFLSEIAVSKVGRELDGYRVNKTILNLSTASDTNFLHTHAEDKVLLYYVNLEWADGWHGETLFFDEVCKDVVHTSAYTPGRVLVFDGGIPHTIRPQSHRAPQYRFTLSVFLDKV
jgi:hypothetical protein